MPGLEISIITAKFKTKAEEPQISRFFSKLLSEFTGRLPRDEWRRTLRGEFVKPIDKRPRQRVGDGRTPRPSILVDGRELPNEMRYAGPGYQVDF